MTKGIARGVEMENSLQELLAIGGGALVSVFIVLLARRLGFFSVPRREERVGLDLFVVVGAFMTFFFLCLF